MPQWTKEVVDLSVAGDALAIDNIKIDGSNIGHTDDTDLLALASGALTVNGSISIDGTSSISSSAITLASSGDTTLDCGADIILDASGEQVYFKKDGTSRLTFNLDSTPEISSNGAFTLSASQITLDAMADIIIDADGDNIKFRAGGVEVAEFLAVGGGRLRLYDDVSDGNYLNFNVGADGESFISTVDNGGGTSGHMHITADGNMNYDVQSGGTHTWEVNGSTVATLTSAVFACPEITSTGVISTNSGIQLNSTKTIGDAGTTSITLDGANVAIAGNLTVTGNLISPNTNASLSLDADGYVTAIIDSDDDNTDREFRVFHNEVDNANRLFRVRENGTACIGAATFSGAGDGNLVIANSTANPSAATDQIVVASRDSAGTDTDTKATLALFCEEGVDATAMASDPSSTFTHRFPIWINGTAYWIALDPV